MFVAGSTGYLGRALVEALVQRGHRVLALTRESSRQRVPAGAEPVVGNALFAASFRGAVPSGATFVHLVGVAHPNPRKAAEFVSIDLASVRAALSVARARRAAHFVYLSVAQPAPVMHAYLASRVQAESLIRASGIPATVLRPWYVLGPQHQWPRLLQPFYWLAERLPATRDMALRLGLVTREQMSAALVGAVENLPHGVRVVEVPEIRAALAGRPGAGRPSEPRSGHA